ncbi:MAG: hypothetical protein MJ219_00505 [Mycoplasmoidaceae bacterium]|nr:hypothetical protein [Mycoplasmoidaceae bacterium]
MFTSDDEGPCGTVSGNIMSLLSENFESLIEIPSEGCFDSLFCQSGISSAADLILPSDELTKFCYAGMFMGCGSLTQPPELTATILAQGCYQFMFSGCWSLTQPPEL